MLTKSVSGGSRRLAIVGFSLAIACALAAAWALSADRTAAHPEHPVLEGQQVSVTPTVANRGDTVTISGHEFAAAAGYRLYAIRDPEDTECPGTFSEDQRITTTGTTDADGDFEMPWRIDPAIVGGAEAIVICGVDGNGDITGQGASLRLDAPFITLDKERAFAGETIRVTGENFSPRRNVEVFVVEGQNTDTEDGFDCQAPDRPAVGSKVTARTDDAGRFTADYPMTEEGHYEAIQWWVCATGDDDKKDHEHIHIVRILRASVAGKFKSRQVLLLDTENRLEIIPGIPGTVSITSVTINQQAVGHSDIVRDGNFKTSVAITPDEATFGVGPATVRVQLDQPVDDESTIRNSFDLLTSYEAGLYVLGPEEASPEDRISVSGAGFAKSQSGYIYAVAVTDQDDPAVCPAVDLTKHTTIVRVEANRDGRVPHTTFELSGPAFLEEEAWSLCGADGAGNTTAPHSLTIVPTVKPANLTVDVIIKDRVNRMRIIPPLGGDQEITGWTLGPEEETHTSDLNLARESDKTLFNLTTEVQPGRYTLTIRVTDGSIANVFEVVEPGTVIGDLAIETDWTEAGPGETIQFTGRGFASNQTVRIYAQPVTTTDEYHTCNEYQPGDPTTTTTARAAGGWGPTKMTLDHSAFLNRALTPWNFCAMDGAGDATITPAQIRMVRVLQFETETMTLTTGVDNNVWIAPGLPAGVAINEWNIGVQRNPQTVEPTDDGGRSRFTVTPTIDPGTYTMTVRTDGGVISATVEVVAEEVTAGLQISAEPDEAGPGETIELTGAGFTPNQTVRIYAQVIAADETEPTCGAYDREDPAVATTAEPDGSWGPTALTLEHERFSSRDLTPWKICALDGSGDITPWPAIITIVRVLQFEHESHTLTQNIANPVWVAPGLDDGATIRGWAIGPEIHDETVPWTLDEQRTRIAVTPTVEAGTYTMTVRTDAGVLSAQVTISTERILTGLVILSDRNEAGPGETIEFTGSGFTPSQTVRVYAQPGTHAAGDPGCAPYDPQDPSFTAPARADGTWGPAPMTLDDERFADPDMRPWKFCAVDGSGETTKLPAVVNIERVLQFALPGNVLLIGTINQVWIAPRLPAGTTVATWAIGPQINEGMPQTTSEGSRTRLDVEPWDTPGIYTMKVTTSSGETLRAVVTVSGDASLSGLPFVNGPSEPVHIGDTVTIVGGNQAPGQTVEIYRTPPADAQTCATAGADGPRWLSVKAGQDGAFRVETEVGEEFDAAGAWALCSIGGDGERSTTPGTITIEHTIILRDDQLVQLRKNRGKVHPSLGTDTTLTSASLGGRTLTEATVTEATEDITALLLRTAAEPGEYTLRLEFPEGRVLSRQVEVIPQDNAAELTLSEEWHFGRPMTIAGRGFRASGGVTLMAALAPQGDDDELVSGMPQEPIGCVGMLAPPEGTAVTRITTWGENTIEANTDGEFEFTALLDINQFTAIGDWRICAVDEDGNVTADVKTVKVRPGLSTPDAEGRVRAGSTVDLTVIPAMNAQNEVTGLRLGKRRQAYDRTADGIRWTSVPELLGNHELIATIDGYEASTVVTILSGRRPDTTIPADAKECVGITGTPDARNPGGSTAMTFTFRLTETGIDCPIAEVDRASEADVGPVLSRTGTTVMPESEVTISLRREYTIPTGGRPDAEISSYANRFGHRYEVLGTRYRPSADPIENHEIVISPCVEWTDRQGDPAPCSIAHAKEITISIDRAFRLPTDASKEYATQITYKGTTVWDVMVVTAEVTTTVERIAFNDELNVTGTGFSHGVPVTIYGVNRSDPRFVIPEEEDTAEWDCRLVVQEGDEVGKTTPGSGGGFTANIDVKAPAFDQPGHWIFCAADAVGTTSVADIAVTIDYEATPVGLNNYRAGATGAVRVNPEPSEEGAPTGMTIGGQDVEIQTDGDRVHFRVPINTEGDVAAVVDFPDDIRAETTLKTALPSLGAKVLETSGTARIGSTIRLEANKVAGERTCDARLNEVPIDLIEGGQIRECLVAGANEELKIAVRISTEGTATKSLVDVFNDNETAELTVETEDGQVLKTTVNLLRPSLKLTDAGDRIKRNVLTQFKPVTVEGSGFPRETSTFSPPDVGYTTADQQGWETRTNDGSWQHLFRMEGNIEEGLIVEFVPTINGHEMPDLAETLTIGVATPQLSVEPGEIETGTIIKIRATGLRGFVGGYWLAITEGDSTFILTDGATGQAFTATTDRAGTFEAEIAFPDWEAEEYGEDRTAFVELQLHNSIGEAIPNATIELRHRIPEEAVRKPQPKITVTPLPTSSAEGIYVTPTGPTPTPPGRPSVAVKALPTRAAGPGDQEDRSVPEPVDHSAVNIKAAPDGSWIQMEWYPAGGSIPADGYVIGRAETKDGAPREMSEPHDGGFPIYRDTTTEPDRTYWYYIVATNRNGESGVDNAAPVRAETPGLPAEPLGMRPVTIGATIAKLNWRAPEATEGDRPRPVESFRLEMRPVTDETPGDWEKVTEVSGYIREWVVIDLDHGRTYEFRVSAGNAVGYGEPSEILRVTMEGEPVTEGVGEAGPNAAATTSAGPPAGGGEQPEVAGPSTEGPMPDPPRGWSLTGNETSDRWMLIMMGLAGAVGLVLLIATIRRRQKMNILRTAAAGTADTPDIVGDIDGEDLPGGLPEPRLVTEDEEQSTVQPADLQEIEGASLEQLIEQLRTMEESEERPGS